MCRGTHRMGTAQAGEPLPTSKLRSCRRAYPRAGGGTSQHRHPAAPPRGLSPRRRGNRPHGAQRRQVLGPIPAQAGEPRSRFAALVIRRAYPRAGGGTSSRKVERFLSKGLSPRRRGNLPNQRRIRFRGGPIPAQAGEPTRSALRPCRYGAYPRAGGGTGGGMEARPRDPGLSPRRRGNRDQPGHLGNRPGPIPAQAGEPPMRRGE